MTTKPDISPATARRTIRSMRIAEARYIQQTLELERLYQREPDAYLGTPIPERLKYMLSADLDRVTLADVDEARQLLGLARVVRRLYAMR